MRSTILSLIAVVVAAVVAVPGLIQAQQPIRIGASIAITGGTPSRAAMSVRATCSARNT